MITVTITDHKISVIGHAGYAPYGQDIVCAGVSALAYTLATSLEQLTRDEVKTDSKSGEMRISLNGNLSRRAKLLVDSFLIGISALTAEYPEHIRLSVDGVKSYGLDKARKS